MTVNGKALDVDAGTVSELLNYLELPQNAVVVEVNKTIVKKEQFMSYQLDKRVKVEIVHFVGGG